MLNIQTIQDVRDFFPSRFLTVEDLKGAERVLVVREVGAEILGTGNDAKNKLLLMLATPEGAAVAKALVVNKTTALTMGAAFGLNPNGWPGKTIRLRPEQVVVRGAITPTIRVYPVLTAAATAPAAPSSVVPMTAVPDPAPQAAEASPAASEPIAGMASDLPW